MYLAAAEKYSVLSRASPEAANRASMAASRRGSARVDALAARMQSKCRAPGYLVVAGANLKCRGVARNRTHRDIGEKAVRANSRRW